MRPIQQQMKAPSKQTSVVTSKDKLQLRIKTHTQKGFDSIDLKSSSQTIEPKKLGLAKHLSSNVQMKESVEYAKTPLQKQSKARERDSPDVVVQSNNSGQIMHFTPVLKKQEYNQNFSMKKLETIRSNKRTNDHIIHTGSQIIGFKAEPTNIKQKSQTINVTQPKEHQYMISFFSPKSQLNPQKESGEKKLKIEYGEVRFEAEKKDTSSIIETNLKEKTQSSFQHIHKVESSQGNLSELIDFKARRNNQGTQRVTPFGTKGPMKNRNESVTSNKGSYPGQLTSALSEHQRAQINPLQFHKRNRSKINVQDESSQLDRNASMLFEKDHANTSQADTQGKFISQVLGEAEPKKTVTVAQPGLRHASSLEKHIIKKIENKVKVDESFFEYRKNLKFQNPLRLPSLILIVLSMGWLLMYIPYYTFTNFQPDTCSFVEGKTIGIDDFIYQFLLFLLVVDGQAILIRVYLYNLMNKKLKTEDGQNSTLKEQQFKELMNELEESKLNVITQNQDFCWKITVFIPFLLLGIGYQYGIMHQMMTDYMIIAALTNHDISQLLFVFGVLLVFFHRLWLVIDLYQFCQLLVDNIVKKKSGLLDTELIDMQLVSMNYINLSNILYKRVTYNKINHVFLYKMFCKEFLFSVCFLALKISILSNDRFIQICDEGIVVSVGVSCALTLVCFTRFCIYICKRSEIQANKDESMMLAVEHIHNYVDDNNLDIVMNNWDCNLILQNLSNYIKYSKSSLSAQQSRHDPHKLDKISIKFDCTLYHKLYKQEIFKIFLQNASVISKNTKINHLIIYETVLSNKDFLLLGQIIEHVPGLKSLQIVDCLLMEDHLFEKKKFFSKNKVVQDILKNNNSFEQEIISYLRIGFRGRTQMYRNSPVPHFHLLMNVVPSTEMDKYGQHICGYYTRVNLHKKRLYEEIGSLLNDFPFISVQLRHQISTSFIQSQGTSTGTHFKSNFMPPDSQSDASEQESIQMRPQNQSIYRGIRRAVMIYDQVDRHYLNKYTTSEKNILFFSQRKIQQIVNKMLQEQQNMDLDLMSIPFCFESLSISKFLSKNKKQHKSELERRIESMKQQVNRQEQAGNEKELQGKLEVDEFINIINHFLQFARYINQLSFRVMIKDPLEAEVLDNDYFAFDKQQALNLLDILRENSHFCILKNFNISSQVSPSRKQEVHLVDDSMLQQCLERTLMSCCHLTHVSISYIKIKDLSGFFTTLLNLNSQMNSIELVNCTDRLVITQSFFHQSQKTLIGLDTLNFQGNNAQLVDEQTFCHFIIMLLKNKNVNFSKNPLFKNRILTNFVRQGDVMNRVKELFAQQENQTIDLETLNLSETFLGINPDNELIFFKAMAQCMHTRPKYIQQIDLSENYMDTYQKSQHLDIYNFQFNRIGTAEFLSFYQVLVANNPVPLISIDLSGNNLESMDLIRMTQGVRDAESCPKLRINLKYNFINPKELTEVSIKFVERLLKLQYFLYFIYNQVLQRLDLAKGEFPAQSPNHERFQSPTHGKKMEEDTGSMQHTIELLISSYIERKKKDKQQKEVIKNSLTKQNLLTQAKMENDLYVQWKELDAKHFQIHIADIVGLDIGSQKTYQISTTSHNESKQEVRSLHTAYYKILGGIYKFINFVGKTQNGDKNFLLQCGEAKYILVLMQKLIDYGTQYKLYYQNPHMMMNVGIFNQLSVLKLKNHQMNESKLLNILRAATKKQLPIRHLNLSKNKISTKVARQIAILAIKGRQLKELILNKVQIELSGLAYIFTVYTNENTEVASDPFNTDHQVAVKNYNNINESLDYDTILETQSLLKADQPKNGSKIIETKAMPTSSLDLLSLKNIGLDQDHLRKLRNRLLLGAQIKHIDISDNLLEDKGAKYFVEYFDSNPFIERISIKNCNITSKGALRLIDLFKSCLHLRELSVNGNENMKAIVTECEKRHKNNDRQKIVYI